MIFNNNLKFLWMVIFFFVFFGCWSHMIFLVFFNVKKFVFTSCFLITVFKKHWPDKQALNFLPFISWFFNCNKITYFMGWIKFSLIKLKLVANQIKVITFIRQMSPLLWKKSWKSLRGFNNQLYLSLPRKSFRSSQTGIFLLLWSFRISIFYLVTNRNDLVPPRSLSSTLSQAAIEDASLKLSHLNFRVSIRENVVFLEGKREEQ